ncbi:MAG TPA: nuclear transport factor 2 family protein [Mycobacteriales bacterium]|nr:nuclear transport factor 2 family protein [Mycobacteriales bacterium]
MSGYSADVAAVEEVNTELYAAVEAGDLDRIGAVWDDGNDVSCVHPGWARLEGRANVLRSWALIMANTAYIEFFLTDVRVEVSGDLAVVTCAENILAGTHDEEGIGESARVVATNVFRRTPHGWRLAVRHGSPVLAPPGPVPEEP